MVPGLRHRGAVPGLAALPRRLRVRPGGSRPPRCSGQWLLFHLEQDTWVRSGGLCHLPNPASLNLAFLSLFFFLSPFSFFTSFFPCNIVFFSKALEQLIYHMQGDRKLSDLVLLFSCRFGIFHKHRVCQLNIY